MPTTLCAVALAASLLAAQAAPPAQPGPPQVKAWAGSVSAGLSITRGNRDTSNFNVAFDVVRDRKGASVFKADGLYLHGKSEKNVTGDQLRLSARNEVNFKGRGFLFGQARYLRDRFKGIDFVLAPSAGIGYDLYESNGSSLGVMGGIGGVWEDDRGRAPTSSGSITFDQKLVQKISSNARITESVSALWKMDDFADSLYTLNAGLAAGISARMQLKMELLLTYKNRPSGTAAKNDTALIMGIVYKI